MQRLCSLISGGKDSIYATYIALLNSRDIVCALSMIPKSDSWMFHVPFINQIDIFQEATNIPLIKIETSGKKEEELKELKRGLLLAKQKYKIDGIITGAIASEYQRMRINMICNELNLDVFSPLWHKSYVNLLKEESNILEFTIVKIAGEGLKKEWLGKVVKEDIVEEILNSKIINPVFEGGEAETLSLNAPFFKKKIKITNQKIIAEGPYNYSLKGTLTLVDKHE